MYVLDILTNECNFEDYFIEELNSDSQKYVYIEYKVDGLNNPSYSSVELLNKTVMFNSAKRFVTNVEDPEKYYITMKLMICLTENKGSSACLAAAKVRLSSISDDASMIFYPLIDMRGFNTVAASISLTTCMSVLNNQGNPRINVMHNQPIVQLVD